MDGIEIRSITKQYQDVTALNGVSFTLEPGKIYGLLGRNGAGKSTLINIIANRIFPDAGQVMIDGIGARENMAVHDKLFCMSEADLYDGDLKIRELLKWTGRFYPSFRMEKALAMAKTFGLDIGKRFKALSKGYQSIFKCIVALALDVPYTIFDEPVLGLDANHRELFYKLLLQEFEEGERTFILATHLIEEVSSIVEEVIFIDQGRVLLQESVEALLTSGYSVAGSAAEVDRYCQGKDCIGTDTLGGLKIAYVMGSREPLPQGSSLQITPMNLQKLFVKLTEKGGNV